MSNVNRRKFLGMLGLGTLGFMSIGSKDWKINDAFTRLAVRTTLDNERVIFLKIYGQTITWDKQIEFYKSCVKAVEQGGLDPMDLNFWDKAKEWNRTQDAQKSAEFSSFYALKASL